MIAALSGGGAARSCGRGCGKWVVVVGEGVWSECMVVMEVVGLIVVV